MTSYFPLLYLGGLMSLSALATSSCSPQTPWMVQELAISESLGKTTPDSIITCWEKPVEPYRVLSELRVDLSQEEAQDPPSLSEILFTMKEKAGRRGANALLLRHRDHTALYKAGNRLNAQSFIQKEPDTGQLFLESKAIWIEESQGTHGGDEAGAYSLPIKDYKKYY